jgi:DNA sulfur modification protein DndD
VQLREVTLRNWRSYRSATFRFPEAQGKKRVILVGAMNGSGKTSLLMSLYLGLFGREAMHYIEGVRLSNKDEEQSRSYRQLMRRILHRPALEEADPSAFVELLFGDDDDHVTITRTWYYRRGGEMLDSEDGEEVRIDDHGQVRSYNNWQEANNKISELLFPPHVTPCFFFDGEQAQERVEASGGRALSDAVTTLFGTGLLQELSASLKTYIHAKNKQLNPDAKDIREDDLTLKRQRADELEASIKETTIQLERARKEHDAAEDTRRAKITELKQVVGDTTLDLQRLSEKKVDLAKQEMELKQAFQRELGNLALPIALRKFGHPIRDRLHKEIVRDRWLIVRDEAAGKAEQILAKALPPEGSEAIIPPLTREQRTQLTSRFRAALEMLWSPPPKDCAADFRFTFLSATERNGVDAKIKSRAKAGTGDVASLATQWSTTKTRLRDLERKWDSVRDLQPKVEKLKQELSELDGKVRDSLNEKLRLETIAKGYESELKDLKGAIGQMESKKRELDPIQSKVDLAYRVRELIEETKDRLVPLCRSAIEARCTEHFRAMVSSEYQRHKVEFDPDYQPMLTAPKSPPIYITTLSGAQKRAFGLAFTLAIAQVSGEDAPLVIDTPVGNMDSEYRIRILTYLAKTAPGQVFFLSHDEEISQEYAQALKPFLLAQYLVGFEPIGDGAGVSNVTPDRYFDH